jgi:hypothetical protein
MSHARSLADLSEAQVRLLDNLCDRFEQSWQGALRHGTDRPHLEQHANDIVALLAPHGDKGRQPIAPGCAANASSSISPALPACRSCPNWQSHADGRDTTAGFPAARAVGRAGPQGRPGRFGQRTRRISGAGFWD